MKPLVAALVITGAPVAAQDSAVLRVAADGSADYQTISAAIEAAAPADTILIAPGSYVENPVIDKAITLPCGGTVSSGNTICAEREPLRLEGGASPQLGTNEICEPGGEASG